MLLSLLSIAIRGGPAERVHLRLPVQLVAALTNRVQCREARPGQQDQGGHEEDASFGLSSFVPPSLTIIIICSDLS